MIGLRIFVIRFHRFILGTIECLSKLVGLIYNVFCNRVFLSAAFVDVQSAYDAINILQHLYLVSTILTFLILFVIIYIPYFIYVIYISLHYQDQNTFVYLMGGDSFKIVKM